MDERSETWESGGGYSSRYERIGCAMFAASGAVSLLITLYLGLPGTAAPLVLPIAFFVTLLMGTLIGLPLLLLAMKLRRVNLVTAALGGFVTGAALPALSWMFGDASSGHSTILLGAAGVLGGVIFRSLLRRP